MFSVRQRCKWGLEDDFELGEQQHNYDNGEKQEIFYFLQNNCRAQRAEIADPSHPFNLHRLVQQNSTSEIEEFYMLFERSLPIFSTTSLEQIIEYFNFQAKIQMDHPVQCLTAAAYFHLILLLEYIC